jgi:multiple sugar transport system substrate-binding protein
MFHVPRNAVYRRINRRRFLELGGGAASALGTGSVAVGLNSVITRRPAYAQSSDDAKWKQYEGSRPTTRSGSSTRALSSCS